MSRGVAGTWNGKHPHAYAQKQRKYAIGECINCPRIAAKGRRCERCRRKHNAEARAAKEKT